MTVIRPNSVSGINSITAQANEIKIFKSDGTQGGLVIGGANLNATSGISTVAALTVTGNVSVGGTLTYQDVTNIDSVGIITARSDLSIADKIIHTGDTNTALRFPAADTITAETAGSERLRITSDGKMGLGISSPARGGLHIHKAATAELHLTDDTTGSGSGDGFTLFSTSSSAGVWYRENAPLRFATYNTERVRISSGGNVGINETAPDRQLHVKSGANSNDGVIRIESANDNIMDVGTDGTGHFLNCVNTDPFRIKFAGTETVRIHSSGVAQFTTTGTQYASASVPAFVVNSNGDHALVVNNQNTTDPRGLFIYQDQDVNNGTSYFWRARAGSSDKAHLYTNGNLNISGGMEAASVNLQSSTTASWFQTGSNYGGADYVWAAKNTQTNTWHSGLKTTGDLYLGGNITATRNISLNGSNGSATFTGKVTIGDSYSGGEILSLGKSSGTSYTAFHNGGANMGFIGFADQLISGGASNELGIRSQDDILFSSGGNTERLRISTAAAAVHVKGENALTGTTGDAKGLSIAVSGGTSCPLYFGSETHSAQKSMYLSGYWIYLRGHQNEGIRFVFSQGSGNAPRSDQYQFKYNQATRPTGNTTWDGFSDRRAKENVQDVTSALDTIGRLRPVTFDWTNDYADRMNMFNMDKTDPKSYNWFSVKENGYDESRKNNNVGFIAQEFEEVFPKDITETEMELGDETITDFKTVNFDSLVPMLTKAVQELKAENDSLKARLDAAGL